MSADELVEFERYAEDSFLVDVLLAERDDLCWRGVVDPLEAEVGLIGIESHSLGRRPCGAH